MTAQTTATQHRSTVLADKTQPLHISMEEVSVPGDDGADNSTAAPQHSLGRHDTTTAHLNGGDVGSR